MSRFLVVFGLIALLSTACSTTSAEPEPEPAPVVQPAPKPEPKPAPVVEPVPAAPAPVAEPARLPETASFLPAVGLSGLGALALAGLLRLVRRFLV